MTKKTTKTKAQAQPAAVDHDRLLKIKDAADRLAVSPATVSRLIASGALPAVKIGKLVRIRPADLTAFVATNAKTLKP